MIPQHLIPTSLVLGAFLAVNAAGASGQAPPVSPHPGEVLFQQRCNVCHGGGDPRAPTIATLRSMTAEQLTFALTEGIMAPQGSTLSAEQRSQLIAYLAAQSVPQEEWITSMTCTAAARRVALEGPVAMRTAGVEVTASRMISAEAAGLSRDDFARLELAWAIAFPGVTGLRAGPVIVGSTVFYSAVNTAKLLALDTESGCVKWVYDSPTPLRSSVSLGEIGAPVRPALFFGDARGQVHAVDAETGAAIWIASGRADEGSSNITGSVVFHDGKVIVPLSASGVAAGSNPDFECCVGRGAVAALDAETGRRLWAYVTMEEAEYTGAVNSAGARLRGPSGAPIWSTPSIDARRGRVYVTTGENTSLPATGTSDAVIALDIETGEALWIFQSVANDVWNMACGARPGPNCPSADQSILRDWDFGGSAILIALADGRELLLAGQKSGHLWALNPDDGSVVWERRVGEGGALGGNHWGIAVDGERVFLPISDPGAGANRMPGMYAFGIATGAPVWEHRLSPDCPPERAERVPGCQARFGLSATPLVVDGAVISAGIDGRLYIFDGESGETLFQFDTARPFEAINGVEGHGGSIDAHSIAAGAGMVFIGSGYGSFSQPPGNVLLGFRPAEN
ncbi:MAG: PQQ-binding-like beta-propeller repeat protein [Gemmatimonadota bacterium]